MAQTEGRAWRWPLAALCVLALFFAADRSVYRSESLWRAFDARLPTSSLLEQGLVQDRLALGEIPDSGAQPQAFLVGSSRLNRGFHPEYLSLGNEVPLDLTVLAHPQFFPFEIRAAVEEIRRHDPVIVLLALSELETHSRIKLVPGSSFGNWAAIWDLTREAGLGFVFERRVMLYRIALGGWFNTYHYRGVINRVGAGRLRSFARDARLVVSLFPEESTTFVDDDRLRHTIEDLVRIGEEFNSRFPGRGDFVRKAQFGIVRSISRGRHAEINMGLVRRSVAALREMGIEVMLIEPPIYPGTALLYDATIRDDFVAFARELVRDQGVHFFSLDDGPGFVEADFGDLTHLDRPGAIKFTQWVRDSLSDVYRGMNSAPAQGTR